MHAWKQWKPLSVSASFMQPHWETKALQTQFSFDLLKSNQQIRTTVNFSDSSRKVMPFCKILNNELTPRALSYQSREIPTKYAAKKNLPCSSSDDSRVVEGGDGDGGEGGGGGGEGETAVLRTRFVRQ